MEIVRIQQPTLEDFAAAAQVCELHWPHLRPLHTPERFRCFQKLGVELVAARSEGRFDGVCFVLPCRFDFSGTRVEWVSLFQLAARPEARNAGGLIMLRIMASYTTVISMGVTDDATKMYHALRWKCFDQVWRGVHPIDLRRMAAQYASRIPSRARRSLLASAGGVYNVASRVMETLLGAGVPCELLPAKTLAEGEQVTAIEKTGLIASYFAVWQVGRGVQFVDTKGIGRILSSADSGWGSIREHARIWGQLRGTDAMFCEILVTSAKLRGRAMRLGYYPVRMPVWYQDKSGMIAKFIQTLAQGEISFIHNDKSI